MINAILSSASFLSAEASSEPAPGIIELGSVPALHGLIVQPKLKDLTAEALFARIEEWESDGGREAEISEAFAELESRPFSLDLILLVVKRRGNPISPAERKLMTRLRRELPDLNKALLSYELLQRETDRMDLGRFRKTELRIGAEVFDAYDTAGADYRFLVHAAGPDEGEIEKVKKKRIRSGFLCTSVISSDCSDFFEHHKNYAMILSADPRNIVATTREDAYTPYSTHDSSTLRFYRFYQRLQLLTGAVERLCREAGIQPLADSLSRLNRLHSLHEQGSLDPEIGEAVKKSDEAASADPALGKDFHAVYKNTGLALTKLREALKAVALSPAHERQAEDLNRCLKALEEIQSDYAIFHDHIHPIQGVGDLLAQTPSQRSHAYNQYGVRPFNEVNLDLETRHTADEDPIAVRAILIDRKAFNDHPGKFAAVLADAKATGIPILLREDPVLPKEILRARLMRAILDQKDDLAEHILSLPGIDAETLGACFILAVGNDAGLSVIKQLLEKGVPERSLTQALDLAVLSGNDYRLSKLLSVPSKAVEAWALAYAASHPEKIPDALAEYLLERGMPISNEVPAGLLKAAVSRHNAQLLIHVYTRCKNQIPEKDLQEAFGSVILGHWGRVQNYLPVELVSWALRFAIEKGLDQSIREILTHEPFLASLTSEEVEEGFVCAAKVCTEGDMKKILESNPRLSDRCFPKAFDAALEKGNFYVAGFLGHIRKELLKERLISAVSINSDLSIQAELLKALAFAVEEIPPAIALNAYQAALLEEMFERANAIQQRFPEQIAGEPFREAWKVSLRSGLFNSWGLVPNLPQELAKWAFEEAVARRSESAAILLARSERFEEQISVEDIEQALTRLEYSDFHFMNRLVRARFKHRERLALSALQKLVSGGASEYLLESFCEEFEISRERIPKPRSASPVGSEGGYALFKASDFDHVDSPAVRQEITLLDLYIDEAAAVAQDSTSVSKAAKGIAKRAPSQSPERALVLAQLTYAAMRNPKFEEPLLELLSLLPENEFAAVKAYLIEYAGMPGNRAKFGSDEIDNLIQNLQMALSPREKILKQAADLAQNSASLPQVVKGVQKKAPSLEASQAAQLSQLVYAGMQSEEFHELAVEMLSQIPEPQFSIVKAYLIQYVQMPGNQQKFGPFAPMEELKAALENTISAVPPLPVKKGALKKREVVAQHGFSLASLALSAIKAPFQLAGWAASGVLNACRRRPQQAAVS